MSDEHPDPSRPPVSPHYGAAPQYGAPGYGTPGYGAPGHGYPPPIPRPGNGMATAGMVNGIISVVLFWLPIIGWILAVLGIVFGGIGISRANSGARGKGMAISGVVLGIASLVLYVVFAAIYVSTR